MLGPVGGFVVPGHGPRPQSVTHEVEESAPRAYRVTNRGGGGGGGDHFGKGTTTRFALPPLDFGVEGRQGCFEDAGYTGAGLRAFELGAQLRERTDRGSAPQQSRSGRDGWLR